MAHESLGDELTKNSWVSTDLEHEHSQDATQQENNEFTIEQHDDAPPAYNLPDVARSSSSTRIPAGVHVKAIKPQARLYVPVEGIVTADESSCTIIIPNANRVETEVIRSILMQQAALPPKPTIHLQGEHINAMGTKKIDFDFRINLTDLIVTEAVYMEVLSFAQLEAAVSGREKRDIHTLGEQGDGLSQWINQFCAGHAEYRSLTLSREIRNLDTAFIHGRIRSILDSTKYCGKVVITFPILYSEFRIVNKPFPVKKLLNPGAALQDLGAWFERLVSGGRNTDKSKQATSTASNAGTVQELKGLKCSWPFASAPMTHSGRTVTVQTENEWLLEWEGVIKNAVLNGRIGGWLGEDDCLSYMAKVGLANERKEDWGRDWTG